STSKTRSCPQTARRSTTSTMHSTPAAETPTSGLRRALASRTKLYARLVTRPGERAPRRCLRERLIGHVYEVHAAGVVVARGDHELLVVRELDGLIVGV